MRNTARTIAKLALCSLMLAVVLRPVVVEANDAHAPKALDCLAGHLQPAVVLSSHSRGPQHLSHLRIIPKDDTGVYGLDPQSTKVVLPSVLECACSSADLFRAHPPQEYFILRI